MHQEPLHGIAVSVLVAGTLSCLAPRQAAADEGMWTFDNFPSAAVKARYDIDIDQPWLDHVRRAAVRLSVGCSASIVDSGGIVLSNHHCVRGCAQQLSTPTQDYVKDGFLAARREDEKPRAGMVAEVLDRIGDVTDRVTAAVAGKSGDEFLKARDAQIAVLEKDGCAGKEDKYRCQVVTLYQGGQYKLYTYRKYTDVRLVFAPEGDTAFFGGDPDNFNFPRYDLDCSFVRLYENGKPVATPDHLRWSSLPPKEGSPLFVARNPGSTARLLTADQLSTLRDLTIPATLILFSELRGELRRFVSESPEHARIANDNLFGIENSFKALRGQERALLGGTLISAKRAADRELRGRIAKDPKLAAEVGDPWAVIATAQLWDGGLEAVQASDDPLIRLVLTTDADSRAVRKLYETLVTGPVDQAQQRIAHARFSIYGTSVYPDATFTLRLSYGKVEGWTDDDVTAAPFTFFAGLWERVTGQFPFALTPRWQDAQGKLDSQTVFDFVSDNDVIGGNSGSPAIDAEGQVVGAVFDGNIESLGGAFGFDDRVNRAVSVSTASITEALRAVYDAEALVTELTTGD